MSTNPMQISKRLNSSHKLPAVCKVVLFFAVIGIITGCITGNLLKTSLYSPLLTIYNDITGRIAELDINKSDIFFLSLKQNIKLSALLYLFALTNLWQYYYCAFSLYTGFTNGLLLAFNIILHGIPGIIRFFCYLCPQAFLFIPLYLFIISHCDKFHFDYSEHGNLSGAKKGKLLLKQFPFFIIIILLILTGSLMEAMLNLPLITWYSAFP